MDKLIEALEAKRGNRSKTAFAAELGMEYTTYWRIIRGDRGVGPDTLARILTVYPDLVRVFLPKESPVGISESPVGITDTQPA